MQEVSIAAKKICFTPPPFFNKLILHHVRMLMQSNVDCLVICNGIYTVHFYMCYGRRKCAEIVPKRRISIMRALCVVVLFMQICSFAKVTVFKAKKIITMSAAKPVADTVVVKDGKVLTVGEFKHIEQDFRNIARFDDRFKKDIIVPGFIEAHMHPQIAGFFWQYVYVGYFDRYDPQGNLIKGCKNKQAVLDRLAQAVTQKKHKEGWIIAWGYQSEFYEHTSLTVDELDPLSDEYKIFVENANMHALYLNSIALEHIGVTIDTDVEGVHRENGKLTGALLELKAMSLALKHLPKITKEDMCNITRAASRLAHRVGVTTMADAAFGLSFLTHSLDAYMQEVPKKDFPQRVALFTINGLVMLKGVDYIKELQQRNTDKLWFDAVKFLTDGSLQCHTANLQWPFYHHCACNGMENISMEELKRQWLLFHEAGLRVAVHVNGSQAIEQALLAAQYVLHIYPRFDHRHSFEHNQMVTEAQLARMKTFGINANFFVNHVYYWGDTHIANLGYARAARLNPLASALRNNVTFSIHSDASVTPVDPLFAMWVAVNRLRYSGKPLGKSQRISAYDALKAVTLDAAHLLGKDDFLGSIEVGKYADFTILDQDPLTVAPEKIKDIKVKATVLEGNIFLVIQSGQWRYLKLSAACRRIIKQFV